ncbi:MAG: hypothetical protein ACRDY7_17035 [Acidimicrobiia bacterium]
MSGEVGPGISRPAAITGAPGMRPLSPVGHPPGMSTRFLIIAALVCGVLILAAGAIQLLLLA